MNTNKNPIRVVLENRSIENALKYRTKLNLFNVGHTNHIRRVLQNSK